MDTTKQEPTGIFSGPRLFWCCRPQGSKSWRYFPADPATVAAHPNGRYVVAKSVRGKRTYVSIPKGEDPHAFVQRLTEEAFLSTLLSDSTESVGMFKEAVIGILAAVAKQERVRLSERTIAGLQRAKAQGRVGGRPKAEDAEPKLVARIGRLRSDGWSIRAIAGEVGESPNTVLRLLKPATAMA